MWWVKHTQMTLADAALSALQKRELLADRIAFLSAWRALGFVFTFYLLSNALFWPRGVHRARRSRWDTGSCVKPKRSNGVNNWSKASRFPGPGFEFVFFSILPCLQISWCILCENLWEFIITSFVSSHWLSGTANGCRASTNEWFLFLVRWRMKHSHWSRQSAVGTQ